ncbi:FAD-binding 8 [Penicillium expansum]|uniref:FAD-binding 8 n=1 Tax=Penicillium expansum TaxID=27334 RepID=A0A0A2IQB8_PENEN|nr:FAD-binding 8 [Penicillium expansum]KGO45244.1 FAD-binding 8 [Penicillium expansum]KGO56547.1 FAD-binding 8 [Penicillium expansum]KGO72315.1 FAD-binding 8 [Penicillium expansum]
MSDSKSTKAAAKAAAKAAEKALRLSNNVWANKYFAIATGAIMVLFVIYHWSSVIHFHYGRRNSHPTLTRKYSSTMGLRTDRSILYIIYWAINLIIALTNIDVTNITYISKRLGWVSIANLVLLVFLALKNTPLAPLAATSYEKLRPLHKVAGYTCIFTSVLHSIVYLSAWSESGSLHKMGEAANFSGAIAGFAMVIIGFSTITYFMRGCYELFYMLHLIMFILIMITVGMHRPDFSTHTVIIVIFTACLWMTDRIIRGAKIVWNFFGNSLTVTALPNNALRVKLSRRMHSTPGSHAFLWVPAIRWVESHPFTLVSSNPSEFVIRVYDGFTRDLYKAAQEAPGRSLRCSVDGAYGQVPNFKVFDKVVLVAGGSGASFTFAIALDLIEASNKAVKSIDFIWIVRNQESLEWFAQELKQLQSHPEVNVLIHVTRQADLSGTSSPSSPASLSEKVAAKDDVILTEPSAVFSTNDPEKGVEQQSTDSIPSSVNQILPGRPNIRNLIAAAASGSGNPEYRIIVGACGPSELMSTTRKAVNDDLLNGGPSITLYTEEFEW